MRRGVFAVMVLLGCSPAADPPAAPAATGASASASLPAPTMPASAPFLAEHTAAIAENPPGVALSVRIKGGQRRFAEGQPIVLELAFTSAQPGTHELDMGTYDRSGRLWSESFRFDPAARVVDPLADYFGDVRGGLGGMRAMPEELSPQPTQVEITLNEWARFTGPGVYHFFVRSTRVERPGAAEQTTASNVVELEIVSDPAWAEKELARIGPILDSNASAEALQAARVALRFLTTPEAAKVTVANLCKVASDGDQFRWTTHAGLFGSPHRAEVIRLLEQALVAPDCAIDRTFLETLARLRGAPAHTPSGMAPLRAVDGAVTELIDALPRKSDLAAPTSLYTALQAVAEGRGAAIGARAEPLRQALARVLGKLPEPALAQLLGDQWPTVQSPAMAAPLLALASEARPRGGAMQSVSDRALQRLVEVDPDGARAFILAELARPGGARLSFSGSTLGLLKDAELPQLDEALASGLKAPERDGISLEQRAEIFARYASKAKLSEAWAAYRETSYFRISLLSYLARHDAKAADAAIAGIKDYDSLQRLSRFLYNGALEALLIQQLDGANGLFAPQLLADRGTVAAEKAMWARLQSAGGGAGPRREVANAMRTAIVRGVGWMTPPEKLRALAATCPDGDCKRQIESNISRWGTDGKRPALVVWSTPRSGRLTGSIGHYDVRSVAELQARIAQLPAGMTLEWQTKATEVGDALMGDVRRWAKARQVEVVARP